MLALDSEYRDAESLEETHVSGSSHEVATVAEEVFSMGVDAHVDQRDRLIAGGLFIRPAGEEAGPQCGGIPVLAIGVGLVTVELLRQIELVPVLFEKGADLGWGSM